MLIEESTDKYRVVLLAGYRYSGRSLTLQRLEAAGYTCVDNLPARMVSEYLAHDEVRQGNSRFAIAVDTAGTSGPAALEKLLDRLEQEGLPLAFVFIEAGASVLGERAQAAEDGRSEIIVSEANDKERIALAAARKRAHLILDSSYSSPVEMKDRIISLMEGRLRDVETLVEILSFGFKYGAPTGDLLLDVRFIPNPYYVAALRPLTGKDALCSEYVLSQESARTSLDALAGLIQGMVPAYAEQGRGIIKVRIGCTGGRHRSVAIAEALGVILSREGIPVRVRHREIEAKRY